MRTPSLATLVLAAALALATPAAARAAPDARATTTVAGVPARVAWAVGTEVRVAGREGVGARVVARLRTEDRISAPS